ncbi:MAG: hypothetical protein IT582_00565 [Opitutaceae bacterium]|nr:hypothetical protein [Opitutaceae bacterium]
MAYLLGGLFLLAFFTVHFGLFHFVHSVFLNHFFPASTGMKAGPSFALYATVFTNYWPFVLVSAVAERSAFRWGPSGTRIGLPGAVGEAVDGADLKPREVRVAGMGGMMAPYKNVVRLHLLIFFFAGASFLKLDRFAVYAVVYAVYFFPWRLVRKAQVNS